MAAIVALAIMRILTIPLAVRSAKKILPKYHFSDIKMVNSASIALAIEKLM